MNAIHIKHMNEPTGSDILATLIKLLAEQEGLTINFEIEGVKK